MDFETVEVDGRIYYYNGQMFFDEFFLVLQGVELQKVSTQYFCDLDYKKMNSDEILDYIKKLKGNGLYVQAKNVMRYAMEKYDGNEKFLFHLLPIFTSCCREMGCAEEAIITAESYYPRIEPSVALCTSLAAACCDMKNYDKAKWYARMAYAKQGGGQGYKTELSLVFLRLKKETGESLLDEEK